MIFKNSLLKIASLFNDDEILGKAKALVKEEEEKVLPILSKYKENLSIK